MNIKRSARKVVKRSGREAWFYENAKSIDVYIRDPERGQTFMTRIPRAMLADWIKRTEPKP